MKDKVLWSHHSIQRAAESKIPSKVLFDAWARAIEQTLSESQKTYKFKKFGMRSLQDRFYWDEESKLLFTVFVAKSGQWFIETVTKGRGNRNV